MSKTMRIITFVACLIVLGGLMSSCTKEYSYTREKFIALPYDKKVSEIDEIKVVVQVFATTHKWYFGAPSKMGAPYEVYISIYKDYKGVSNNLKLDAIRVDNVSKNKTLNIIPSDSKFILISGGNYVLEPNVVIDGLFESGDMLSVIVFISMDNRKINYQIKRMFKFERESGTSELTIWDIIMQ